MFKKRTKPAATQIRTRQASPDATGSDVVDDGSSSTVADLLALRKLKQAEIAAGIDAAKLNEGGTKKRKHAQVDYGLSNQKLRSTIESLVENDDDPNSISKKLAKSDNFTQQTNMVDVDKHMMAFIEEELKKKRKAEAEAKGIKLLEDQDAQTAKHDELWSVAAKYKVGSKPAESNVTLSSAMLTSIPEVDLGIDVRIRNIEETERAKRALFEKEQAEAAKRVTAAELEAESFARERFWRPALPSGSQQPSALAASLQSDKELLKLAREAAARGEIDEWDVVPNAAGGTHRQRASDDQVVARYKDRARKNAQAFQKGVFFNK